MLPKDVNIFLRFCIPVVPILVARGGAAPNGKTGERAKVGTVGQVVAPELVDQGNEVDEIWHLMALIHQDHLWLQSLRSLFQQPGPVSSVSYRILIHQNLIKTTSRARCPRRNLTHITSLPPAI